MLHPRLPEEFLHGVQERIVPSVDDLADAGVDDQLCAGEARRNGDVYRGALDGVAVQGGLADGVLLGVDAEALLEVRSAFRRMGATRAAAGEAVYDAVGRSVVAGGEYVAVPHDHCGDMSPGAVRARCHHLGDVHEVRVPVRARIFDGLCHMNEYYTKFFAAVLAAVTANRGRLKMV